MVSFPFHPYQEWDLGLAWANVNADAGMGIGARVGQELSWRFKMQKLLLSARIAERLSRHVGKVAEGKLQMQLLDPARPES